MASVIHALGSTLYYVFYGSYKTGDFIVKTASTFVQCMVTVFSKALLLIRVLSEDFSWFVNDLANILDLILSIGVTVVNFAWTIQKYMFNICSYILKTLDIYYNNIHDGTMGTFRVIGWIFVSVKHVIMLFGEGIWFLITTPIMSTLYLSNNIVGLIIVCKHACVYLAELISDSYNFITDVPLESVGGLIIFACLVYVLIEFYVVLYRFTVNKIDSIFGALRAQYYYWKRRFRQISLPIGRRTINRVSPRNVVQTRPPLLRPKQKSPGKADDRLCIICQERDKCILLLPCRHLCMCQECNIQLTTYNSPCPICRKKIDQTMRVFM